MCWPVGGKGGGRGGGGGGGRIQHVQVFVGRGQAEGGVRSGPIPAFCTLILPSPPPLRPLT